MNASYNGFRAIAFLAVFLFHCDYFDCGYLGVQAFFVLSGYLITPILIKTKESNAGFNGYYRNFITRRTLRIFPLYYLYILVLLLGIVLFNLESYEYFNQLKGQLVFAFTYTYNFFHGSIFFRHNSFISHFWSLAVEEQFYIFWPLLIFFINTKYLKTILIIFIVAGPLLRFLTGVLVDMDIIPYLSSNKQLVIYTSTFSHLDAFATGAFFNLFYKRIISNLEILLTLSGVIAVGLVFNYLTTDNFQFGSFGYPKFMDNSLKDIWGYSIFNYCFGIILFKMKTNSFFPVFFENQFIAYLGKISYGLYVYHFAVIVVTTALAGYLTENFAALSHIPDILINITALVFTIIISSLSYHFFEEKFILLKDLIAPKHTSALTRIMH